MSHDVYILSILCAISMYISFFEFVQTAHTREKKSLLFSFFEDDDIFPRASSSHHGYWNSLQGPFFDFVLCLCCGGIFFCRFFQQCQMISGVIWSGFSRLFLQPFATLYFTVHSLKPNYSSIIE